MNITRHIIFTTMALGNILLMLTGILDRNIFWLCGIIIVGLWWVCITIAEVREKKIKIDVDSTFNPSDLIAKVSGRSKRI